MERAAHPHGAGLRRGRTSQCLALYFITKCVERPSVLTAPQRGDIVDALYHFRGLNFLYLHAFVIMPDHWHALFTLGDGNPSLDGAATRKIGLGAEGRHSPDTGRKKALDTLMRDIGRRASYTSRRQGGRIDWQDGYHDRSLRVYEHVVDVVRYIEDNPVRKGLVEQPSEWPWSSAHPDYANRLDRRFLGHERWEV